MHKCSTAFVHWRERSGTGTVYQYKHAQLPPPLMQRPMQFVHAEGNVI